MLLIVDAARGKCFTQALPPSLAILGGRALAVLLAKGEVTSHTQESCLVLAPGLLAHHTDLQGTRLSLASKVLGHGLWQSSAGGAMASALARLGIRALLVQGQSPNTEIHDLVIDEAEARLVPSLVPPCRDLSQRMADLARRWPQAACLISVSRLGPYQIPLASISISDAFGHPKSHAGSFSGFLLGLAGIGAIVIQNASTLRTQRNAPATLLASLKPPKTTPAQNQAEQTCSFACSTCQAKEGPGPKHKKWPDFAKSWSFESPKDEHAFLERYVDLCDQLEVDAFALAKRLSQLERLLPKNRPDLVLQELRRLNEQPSASQLLLQLQGWFPEKKDEKTSERRLLIETLGLCRFAQPLRKDPQLLTDLVLRLTGLSAEEYRALASTVLLAESSLARTKEE
ncbi:MAG: hypothetical protein K6G15_11030 [Desulfovibrio sp.]|nr:hypothetical protein [Desulfovibrio sp.]